MQRGNKETSDNDNLSIVRGWQRAIPRHQNFTKKKLKALTMHFLLTEKLMQKKAVSYLSDFKLIRGP